MNDVPKKTKRSIHPNLRKAGFKPGQSGNPGGRPKVSPMIKAFRETTEEEFIKALHMYGSYFDDEIEEYLASNIGQTERFMAQFIRDAALGKEKPRELLIERIFGKLKEQVDFTVRLKSVSDAELIEITKEAIKVLEGEAKPIIGEEK